MMRELYAIPNHSEQSTFKVKPSEFESHMPEEVRVNKRERSKWSKDPKTEHCFFTGFEGIDPHCRLNNQNNPANKCLAIVADYDCNNATIEDVAKHIVEQDMPHRPYEICLTGSGGVRAIWYPEEPLPLTENTAKPFMEQIARDLHLLKMVGGLDLRALCDPSKTYEVGRQWIQINPKPLPTAFCWTSFFKAAKRCQLGSLTDREFPLERARTILTKKYPEYDFPVFAVKGERMKRFWDPDADAKDAVTVLEGGLYCFTEEYPPFIPWRDERLVGPTIMREFEEARTGDIVANHWYDGKSYISYNKDTKKWRAQKESDFRITLSGKKYRLSSRVAKGETSSPVNDVIEQIQSVKEVYSAAHFVFQKQGPCSFNGQDYINVSQVEPMAPSGKHGEWREWFPFIGEFLDSFFVSEFQKTLFLAWWKVFYTTSRELKPVQGQAMFIAGPQGCGKSLINLYLLKPSMGGGKDAAQYYVEDNRFNEGLYTHGLHTVDDAEPGHRQTEQKKMAARYKRTVASPEITVEEKGTKRKQIQWLGRVCTTMNCDADSLSTMPELQETLEDKVIILRAKVPGDLFQRFPAPTPLKEVEKELPHFLQWLDDWEIPEEVINKDNPRFIIKSFCDAQLRRDMREGSEEELFAQLLDSFLIEVQASEEGKYDDGTPRKSISFAMQDLKTRMLNSEAVESQLLNPYMNNAKRVPQLLKEMNRRGYGCRKTGKRRAAGPVWELDFELFPKEEDEDEA